MTIRHFKLFKAEKTLIDIIKRAGSDEGAGSL